MVVTFRVFSNDKSEGRKCSRLKLLIVFFNEKGLYQIVALAFAVKVETLLFMVEQRMQR